MNWILLKYVPSHPINNKAAVVQMMAWCLTISKPIHEAKVIKLLMHICITWLQQVNRLRPGPWFNIKMSSYRYRKSHCGDKTVIRSSYLYNVISYTTKSVFHHNSNVVLFKILKKIGKNEVTAIKYFTSNNNIKSQYCWPFVRGIH